MVDVIIWVVVAVLGLVICTMFAWNVTKNRKSDKADFNNTVAPGKQAGGKLIMKGERESFPCVRWRICTHCTARSEGPHEGCVVWALSSVITL